MTPVLPRARAPPEQQASQQALNEFLTMIDEFQIYLTSAITYFQRIELRYLDVGRLAAISQSFTSRADQLLNFYSDRVFRKAITDRRQLRPIGQTLIELREEARALAYVLGKHRVPTGTRLRRLLLNVRAMVWEAQTG